DRSADLSRTPVLEHGIPAGLAQFDTYHEALGPSLAALGVIEPENERVMRGARIPASRDRVPVLHHQVHEILNLLNAVPFWPSTVPGAPDPGIISGRKTHRRANPQRG